MQKPFASLMTADHIFQDALGQAFHWARQDCAKVGRAYFKTVADYQDPCRTNFFPEPAKRLGDFRQREAGTYSGDGRRINPTSFWKVPAALASRDSLMDSLRSGAFYRGQSSFCERLMGEAQP